MPKNLPLRSIRNKRSYSSKELAHVLGVHIRTVQSWYQNGMPIIDGSHNPFLILGKDAKAFLKRMEAKRRTILCPDECYCVGCRKAVVPNNQTIGSNNQKLGGNKDSIVMMGDCPLCDRIVYRFGSVERKPVQNIPSKTEIKNSQKEEVIYEQSTAQLSLFI